MSIRHEACQTCGTLLEYANENAVVTCPACGTCNKLPDERVRDRADFRNARALQQRGDFLDAEASYQRVLDDIPDDADALWGRLLCHYGAALITDAGPQRRYTIRIPRSKPLRAQGDYERVLESAPAEMVAQYESDAAYIDLAMLRIRRLAETKAPYDIFICHKTTPLDGKGYTEDYARGRDLRDLLIARGYRVFFAPVDMEGVSAGEDYEAGIYHALNTARVMLVICSDPQHLQSTWVRSEWERYLTRVDEGQDASLIPLLYGGMKANSLPRAYQIRNLQAILMELEGKDRLLERLGWLIPGKTAAVPIAVMTPAPAAVPVPAAAPVPVTVPSAAPVPVTVPAAAPVPVPAPSAVPANKADKPRKSVMLWVLLICVVLGVAGGAWFMLQQGEKDAGDQNGMVRMQVEPTDKAIEKPTVSLAPSTNIELSPDTLKFSASAGTQRIRVDANCAWTVSEKESWITVTKTSSGVDVSVTENTSLEDMRKGTITFTYDGLTKSVNVEQETAAPEIKLSVDVLNVGAAGGTKTVNVNVNGEWHAYPYKSWIEVSEFTNGVNVIVEENTTTVQRTGTITIACGDLTETVTVKQEGAAPAPTATPMPYGNTILGGATKRLTISEGEMTLVKFTAQKTGIYVFTTASTDDTVGFLYRSTDPGSLIITSDNNGSSKAFRIAYEMEAGETVYLGVKYKSGRKAGTIILTIKQQ